MPRERLPALPRVFSKHYVCVIRRTMAGVSPIVCVFHFIDISDSIGAPYALAQSKVL